MTAIDRGALLELVRARPLLAAELLGAALAGGEEEPIDGEALRRRFPCTDLASTDAPTLAAPYPGTMAGTGRARAHEAGAAFARLIAFLRARIEEGLDQADSATDAGEPGTHKAERDLAAKRDRMDFLESVLVHGLYLTVEEHLQAEHLLKLEAAAYDWHDDYQDAWQP
ncbi:hypothetical protein [Microbispora hainanensis]|uniref:Uncharacterized protein n=1 Tax=Microbispora hainanensis TaxID=568844 RepID=A0A544YQ51_9ACTN|nr:hypothetical protein [Microbispora hainanensis]TQS18901.1 hypothetical protein FLX08_22295 [Microbispora hainanensis]